MSDTEKGSSLTPEEAREEMLKVYPKKAYRKRSKQLLVNDPDSPKEIGANSRTIPGIITQRGCTYAGCRGVVIGPIYDILHITHGPIGCGYYSWLTRRNLVKPKDKEQTNFIQYCMSTDMQEDQIVFGGEKKLAKAIDEAIDEFSPKAIAIYATCPVGLIGDDIHSVAREAEKRHPGVNIMGFSCEGYKGVSQSAGHHIANNKVFTDMIGLDDTPQTAKYSINILGEYNIGGDAWEIERIFEKCGINIVGTLSGDVSYDQIANCHTVDLNTVMCHRSINYIAEMMEKKYGIPWFKVNFIGADSTAKSLRKIAEYFEDKELMARVESVIAEEKMHLQPIRDSITERCKGKTAALFVGGSRAHHYQDLFNDIGMEVVAAGYEFAHRDDYEGRVVLPTIKVDADSRNIEDLTVEADPTRFKQRLSDEQKAAREAGGFSFEDYEGMMKQMGKESLVIDDISHHELDKLIELYKPDVICSGIKDKYVIEKFGVPCKQLHSYDYSGPYAGFEGAANFYKEIDRMVNSHVWGFAVAPWQKDPDAAFELKSPNKDKTDAREAATAEA
ncbi:MULTISPECIES: nitrogenase molybdenum-iron protein alpha chain [unclassified Lentimonas]|uniref:nitrogenase molybdenum-iron protein alpha chain n=1 Tax=unclassified Lentimonas TaxID=2630993 RepID=UPI001329BAE0|nr:MULTISPECIES: nitrogenase molybdenum-iron protein alpha chain [unclassified Lentimonas]CAA6677151.1 Nitrogenase (molybdenum-iron) alpha chain (EC [Lentimonas sp. CC4]CAA6686225.1 Nitrogenase (molybdenum-iron) alpha chain (EC [Lentimonas sp. CC6]CAA6694978.1 Nitrogenase (molybdenum-iron) alpha chain (EC [Lentimonas sp. CC19]CAA6695330.1 Nitrogenase (molybdenum-iron) alpha chain (EC [Lentimonas sp. CC10]CAA7072010.1 Nitrogenase (molybdenum-iron) alpha chain (EC [Lentimonas sp. CC11]